MARLSSSSESGAAAGYRPRERYPARLAGRLLATIAVVYAFLAGLHTVADLDLGWQLATGRWVFEHHRVFSADVFSYTAAGQPWIYPAFSGVIFYITFLAGGYALLSWLGALTSAATIAVLLSWDSLASGILAVIAVPLIANRTQPRAEMFTTILFAVFLVLLWKYYRTGRSPLWLLPLLMILWVNLHPGFIAGLGMCAGYLLLEALALPFPSKRQSSTGRVRRALPWLGLTVAATLVNPWGPWIYAALIRQQQAQALHNLWVVEWERIHPSWASWHQALNWRGPQGSLWWLMAAMVVVMGIAIWRKEWGAALLLAASAYLVVQHVRMQALFACVVVVIGGSLIEGFRFELGEKMTRHFVDTRSSRPRAQGVIVAVIICLIIISVATVRSRDLISNRYYLRSTQLANFGAGLSWWFPQRALDFLQREKLPANVFNGYSLGGYFTWRAFPDYRDYIDSRALPFGPELFFRAYDLSTEPPNSPAWQQEAESRGIRTIIIPLGRYQGMTLFPQLHAFCRSTLWRPVYLDEVSAIFVRATPQTAALIDRLQIDCDKSALIPPDSSQTAGDANPPHSFRSTAALFNFYANAGGVLYSLERYPEALTALDRAQSIFAGNANVHLVRALVFQQTGRNKEAEAEFRTSLSLEPSDEAWFDWGLFYMTEAHYPEAANIFRQTAESSARPHEMWMMLGQADLGMHQSQPALEAFEKAEQSSPFSDASESLGTSFRSLIATGRAKAWYQLGDVARAVSYQEEAVRLAPNDPRLWSGLADLYSVQGRTTKAAEARSHASAASPQPSAHQ
jgi:tetratricopeptide (TPR) repeat protein